jgi:hypothetical protein
LAEATLRLPFAHGDYRGELLKAFKLLFALYGDGVFDVVTTANVVLVGTEKETYRVFYGQDFGKESNNRSFALNNVVHHVKDLSDATRLRTSFNQSHFEKMFFGNFEDSDVRVHSMINVVYIIRRFLGDYANQRRLPDNVRMRTLY